MPQIANLHQLLLWLRQIKDLSSFLSLYSLVGKTVQTIMYLVRMLYMQVLEL